MPSLRFSLRSQRLCVERHPSSDSNSNKINPYPPMTCLPSISDCPSPHGIAQNGRKTHAALPQTARRQSRQRLSHHRTPLPGKQGPLRPKLPQTRIHRLYLRRRPPRRHRRGRQAPRRCHRRLRHQSRTPSIPKVFLAILAFFARNNVFSSSIESPSAAPAEQTRYWAVSQVPTLAPNRLPKPPARWGAGGGCTIVDSRGNCPKSDVVTPD